MAKSTLTEQDENYLRARRAAGTYNMGDAERKLGFCEACQTRFYERQGAIRDAGKGLAKLRCHYCKEAEERYADLAAAKAQSSAL